MRSKSEKGSTTSIDHKNEYFSGLTRHAQGNEVKFDYILAGNWFGATENMECIHYGLKKTFIFWIEDQPISCPSIEERKKGQYDKSECITLQRWTG